MKVRTCVWEEADARFAALLLKSGPCENAAVPCDWFGRAQAAVICIMVNDYHEATYFIRAPMPMCQ
jgi:hypothetical protein